jgi:hypothetical protein
MNDPREWTRLPVLASAVRRWWSARGGAEPGQFKMPYSCDWEDLLSQAGLISAEHRREADRDARRLEESGLLKLKLVKYRPYEIERLTVPFTAESRLKELFADDLPATTETLPDLSGIDWQPELSFLPDLRTSVPLEDLLKLDQFFQKSGRDREPVPIKERSLQIFGDEKRLDALRVTALFRPHQLSLELLRCFTVPLPFGWKRGPNPSGPILVLENAATWDSYCRWNMIVKRYSAVVFGNGYQFSDSTRSLTAIFEELGGSRPVLYFGDLDPTGVWIPQQASKWMQKHGHSPILADLPSYAWLLQLGSNKAMPRKEGCEDTQSVDLSWLGAHAHPVEVLFAENSRLAQEHVSWDFLRNQPAL